MDMPITSCIIWIRLIVRGKLILSFYKLDIVHQSLRILYRISKKKIELKLIRYPEIMKYIRWSSFYCQRIRCWTYWWTGASSNNVVRLLVRRYYRAIFLENDAGILVTVYILHMFFGTNGMIWTSINCAFNTTILHIYRTAGEKISSLAEEFRCVKFQDCNNWKVYANKSK